MSALRGVTGVTDVRATPDGCEVHLAAGTDPTPVLQQIAATVRVARIALARLRLEDVFLRLVAVDTQSPDAERALRENLRGVGEGAAS
jgi:hypothetical protein